MDEPINKALTTNVLDYLIKEHTKLPTSPAVAVKILEKSKDPNFSVHELTDILSVDPAMTAKILSIANSSFYALPQKADSVSRAVSVLGLSAIKNIALSFAIVSKIRESKATGFDYDRFWKEAVTQAVATSMSARMLNLWQENLFIIALLSDIGKVIMFLCRPDDYLAVMREQSFSDSCDVDIEKDVFGFDHQDVGAEILKRWGIPESIYLPVAFHHNRAKCPREVSNEVAIAEVAGHISSLYHGNNVRGEKARITAILNGQYGLDDPTIDELLDGTAYATSELLSFFEISSSGMKPYSQILQEAHEELGKLNLSQEQLVVDLMHERKHVHALMEELREANKRLKEFAFIDGLTGLYNYRFFHELIKKEIDSSIRYKHPLSLVLLDIDHFKCINDTYGHLNGDLALEAVASVIRESCRASDTAARYGGEEFVVMLPQTDLKNAALCGEKLRKEVEHLQINLSGDCCKMTVSVGVCTFDPKRAMATKEDLINGADRAMYHSKETGRNRVSVTTL